MVATLASMSLMAADVHATGHGAGGDPFIRWAMGALTPWLRAAAPWLYAVDPRALSY